MRLSRLSPLLILILSAPSQAGPFEFKSTDRVVLVGGTLIEREQRYGYWEAMLTARYPGIKFRNLGWSGDNVFGEARRAFDLDKPDIGRKRLVELALAEKPTVILIGYGGNEAFAGDLGLDSFKKGLDKLLDELAPAKARIVLMSPPPMEDRGRPLPDPAAQNKRLASYRDAIKQVAESRSVYFADLFSTLGAGNATKADLTDNGLHFTEAGYQQTTAAFATALGLPTEGAYSESLEPLRQAIRKKNELYFHRWRPQNETYLFGFRKHEQGKNAKEVAEFDPLVAAAEGEIEKLLKK
ncbi:MAG TPA: SGNH/GDSL hydrolase family protein [Gemmataceae bacterium]|nr:SGNH/GDSL hydrolase family protein [Gemmataceae bacterium]